MSIMMRGCALAIGAYMSPTLPAGPAQCQRPMQSDIDREPTDPRSSLSLASSAEPQTGPVPNAKPHTPLFTLRADGPASRVPKPSGDDRHLLGRLRDGDETAFAALVNKHHRAMVRFAMRFVRTRASAEDVAQDTWLAALNGLNQFQGRSSISSWIYAILINKAKSRGRRDFRDVAVWRAAAQRHDDGTWNESVAERISMEPEEPWDDIDPERILAGRQIREVVHRLIDALPEPQRAVITLQDINGQDAVSVCRMLGLTDANRRVLLHRARSRVRTELRAILGPRGLDS